MSNQTQGGQFDRVLSTIDLYFMPIVGGCLTLLILVQLFTAVPPVRRAIDQFEGRFVAVSANEPNAPVGQEATLTLYVSPAETRPDVAVLINGIAVVNFKEPQVLIHVKNDDKIEIKSRDGKPVVVTIDHNNPNMIVPAPGQTITIGVGQNYAVLAPVRFS